MKKYKLTDETIQVGGHTLHRIEALKDFSDIKNGDKGGFIESEENLSHDGDCWVYDTAKVWEGARVFDNAEVYCDVSVYGNASIYEDAIIYSRAEVYGNARVFGEAIVHDYAEVCGDAEVGGNVRLGGNAKVRGDAKVADISDYIVFKNWWSSGRYFTWTRSNNMWSVGCFFGTGEELIAKAYKDSELSGREYERVVKYVESILKDNKNDKR